MDAKTITNFAGVLTSIAAVGAAFLGIFKYFNYRSRQDELRLIGGDFHAVVAALRSDSVIERMAGAISLRRFYDARTESGKGGAPYSKEALNVTTAILRGQATSDFQKLLADGLAFAPSLHKADLQKTNLQSAYLGNKGADNQEDLALDLSFADFYRADLSRASLKGANARGAKFYQSRMLNTVLSNADLREANFFEADLSGSRFDGALLQAAKFGGARNIPATVAQELDERGVYQDSAPCPKSPNAAAASATRLVFVSKPGYLTPVQQQRLDTLMKKLESEGLQLQTLDRPDYPGFGTLGEVRRIMSGCSGAIIYGFPELRIAYGSWRLGTPEEKRLREAAYGTPWSQIEAGMAAMVGIPLLLLREREVTGGIFELAPGEPGVYTVCMEEDWNASAVQNAFSNWCADVRDNNARPPAPAVKTSS